MSRRLRALGRQQYLQEDSEDESDIALSDSDSDSDSSDYEDYTTKWAGLTTQQLRTGKGYAQFSNSTKTQIFQFAIENGFCSKNLPTPQKLLEMCIAIDLPCNAGVRVVKTCVQKLVSWIKNNVTEKNTVGLVQEKCVGKLGRQNQYEIKVSDALIRAVQDAGFNYATGILGKKIFEKHARGDYMFKDLRNITGVQEKALVKDTIRLLHQRYGITKEPKQRLASAPRSRMLDRNYAYLSPSPSACKTPSVQAPVGASRRTTLNSFRDGDIVQSGSHGHLHPSASWNDNGYTSTSAADCLRRGSDSWAPPRPAAERTPVRASNYHGSSKSSGAQDHYLDSVGDGYTPPPPRPVADRANHYSSSKISSAQDDYLDSIGDCYTHTPPPPRPRPRPVADRANYHNSSKVLGGQDHHPDSVGDGYTYTPPPPRPAADRTNHHSSSKVPGAQDHHLDSVGDGYTYTPPRPRPAADRTNHHSSSKVPGAQDHHLDSVGDGYTYTPLRPRPAGHSAPLHADNSYGFTKSPAAADVLAGDGHTHTPPRPRPADHGAPLHADNSYGYTKSPAAADVLAGDGHTHTSSPLPPAALSTPVRARESYGYTHSPAALDVLRQSAGDGYAHTSSHLPAAADVLAGDDHTHTSSPPPPAALRTPVRARESYGPAAPNPLPHSAGDYTSAPPPRFPAANRTLAQPLDTADLLASLRVNDSAYVCPNQGSTDTPQANEIDRMRRSLLGTGIFSKEEVESIVASRAAGLLPGPPLSQENTLSQHERNGLAGHGAAFVENNRPSSNADSPAFRLPHIQPDSQLKVPELLTSQAAPDVRRPAAFIQQPRQLSSDAYSAQESARSAPDYLRQNSQLGLPEEAVARQRTQNVKYDALSASHSLSDAVPADKSAVYSFQHSAGDTLGHPSTASVDQGSRGIASPRNEATLGAYETL